MNEKINTKERYIAYLKQQSKSLLLSRADRKHYKQVLEKLLKSSQ